MAEDDRVAVKTYVPRQQKEIWSAQADDLEMSQSEFVRTMVQAGRSEFEIPSAGDSGGTEPGSDAPADEDFADRILEVLQRSGALDWDDLVEALVDDVEAELDAEIQRLQDDNLVRYSGREGGYVVTSDE
ncbi:DUF5805 domain-containing protein [Natronorubrum daqingense]|uniref:Uncharacterized protein n=1 Tax=Natronorubrum daqingense TaxID=588898 RepID=A0A1N6X9M7_9EURY|nr:DUF5805 domain-containing protein [Natronorubrum daqingense]APX96008.1 hypothetical protein BB347_04890 [Natronorubrum daqingense]SIQ99064.1 hypothetical protein SAMN05421809_0053 [Natronorubrum daqingense]